MTLLEIELTVPAKDGTLTPANGIMRFAPTRRRHEGGVVVLPVPFTEQLTLGVAAVELEPTTADWVWRIDEHVSGSPSRTIYTTIPDAASILYTDLVAIDPSTLAPTAAPPPAWTVRVDNLETSLASGLGEKLDSGTAATTYAAKSVETSKLDASEKGTASGVAPLDAGSRVPEANLPAHLAQATLTAAIAATITPDPNDPGFFLIGAN